MVIILTMLGIFLETYWIMCHEYLFCRVIQNDFT